MRLKMELKKKRVYFQIIKMKGKRSQMILVNGALKMELRKYNKVFSLKKEMRVQQKEMSRKMMEDLAGNKIKKANFHILIQHKTQ